MPATQPPREDEGTAAKEIGIRIRTLRQQQGLTLTDLAGRAGVSKSYLSTVEHGSGTRPGAAILHRLAVALGLTIADLLGRGVRPDTADEEIPTSLLEFARSRGLPQTDVDMLVGIKFRGHAPRTADRWQFIYDAIILSAQQESAQTDERKSARRRK